MNPLPYIEKWISEHGSASVLRDHVGLLKTQMEKLESEIDSLKTSLKNVEAERDSFKAQTEKLQSQLDDARKEIERYNQRPTVRVVG